MKYRIVDIRRGHSAARTPALREARKDIFYAALRDENGLLEISADLPYIMKAIVDRNLELMTDEEIDDCITKNRRNS